MKKFTVGLNSGTAKSAQIYSHQKIDVVSVDAVRDMLANINKQLKEVGFDRYIITLTDNNPQMMVCDSCGKKTPKNSVNGYCDYCR